MTIPRYPWLLMKQRNIHMAKNKHFSVLVSRSILIVENAEIEITARTEKEATMKAAFLAKRQDVYWKDVTDDHYCYQVESLEQAK